MKHSQSDWVIERLKETGEVTRNECLSRPPSLGGAITRLSALIQDLEEAGWLFYASRRGKDYVYKLLQSPQRVVSKFIPMETENGTIMKEIRVLL